MSLYTHWVCFDCRKSFHKKPNETTWKCPQCTNAMTDMGVYFEPPRRQAKEKWRIIKLLAENNYKFTREGHKVLIEKFIFGGKNPSFERVKEAIEAERNSREQTRILQKKKEKKFGSI
jgi:hypothetical protein